MTYYAERKIEELRMQNGLLKRKVELYESQDPVASVTQWFESKITQMQQTIEKIYDGWDRCREELRSTRADLANEKDKSKALSRELTSTKKDRNKSQKENDQLQNRVQKLESEKEQLTRDCEEKDKEILALKAQLAAEQAEVDHLQRKEDRDGTNSGTPTSQTPINKNKVIPNCREKSGRHVGGQEGHERRTMNEFDPESADEKIPHELPEEDRHCDHCGGQLIFTGKTKDREEIDIEIRRVKKLHRYFIYRCSDCGKEICSPIPPEMMGTNHYGSNINAMALELMTVGNMTVNKTQRFFKALLDGEVASPSSGYLEKLMARTAKKLEPFRNSLRERLIQQRVIYWDDTVIMIDTKRGCMRVYCTNKYAFFIAHVKKDLEGIKEDAILTEISEEQFVEHDHNKTNYNEIFVFYNLECNQHLLRDLMRNSQDTGHKWSEGCTDLIKTTIHERNKLALQGADAFPTEKIEEFHQKLHECLNKGKEENQVLQKKVENLTNADYGFHFEKVLLTRLDEYEDNYFRWLEDFTLPVTDNLSERSLRSVKSHMKISGQFKSVETADTYAILRSYVETCRRHGVNEMTALKRLAENDPYTIEELDRLVELKKERKATA